jgi:L-fuculose-phosphate aldolase
MENCDICANDVFRDSWKQTGVERRAFEAPPAMRPKSAPASAPAASGGTDQEALIRTITERVLAALAGK